MPDPELVVYEKNTCSTCRNLFTLLREKGIDYETVEYHVTGLSEAEIRDLLVKLSAAPRDILRIREPLVEDAGHGTLEKAQVRPTSAFSAWANSLLR